VKLYGIDGCKGGWVVAEGAGEGRQPAFRVLERHQLGPLFEQAERGEAIVVIDMPIGLPERGPRPCDQAARQQVGPARASSVFPVPCRAAVRAGKKKASEANFRKTGRKLSKQSLAILERIKEVDDLMTPDRQLRVREGHPEVTFAALNGGALDHPKKTEAGKQERLCILRRVGIVFDPHDERERLGRGVVAVDDIIDAAACLATARRLAAGTAAPLAPPTDAKGLRMEIVA